jgi:pimeloyl-ACP methyl ester carboxylesterase
MHWRDWKATQETVTVTVEDGYETHRFEVAYRDVGSDGPVTLFLHGLPTWSYLWRNVHDAVSNALIPDLAGHGFTRHVSNQASYSRSVRFQERFVAAFLDELGVGTVRIVGHDWGGAAATRFAIHSPDRVDRMVLSNIVCYDNFPLGTMSTSIALPRRIEDDVHVWDRMDRERLEDELDGMFHGTVDPPSERFVEGMKAPFLTHPADDLLRLSKNAVSANTNNTLEVSGRYGDIESDVLLLWGGEDRVVPVRWAERLAADIPNSETVALDRAYHWVPEDRPDAYRRETAAFLG